MVKPFSLSGKLLLIAITPAVSLFIFLQFLMKLCFQKPHEFFLKLLRNSVYSAISFPSIYIFLCLAGHLGSFPLQIIWWWFDLKFLSVCWWSPTSLWVASAVIRFGWDVNHLLQSLPCRFCSLWVYFADFVCLFGVSSRCCPAILRGGRSVTVGHTLWAKV